MTGICYFANENSDYLAEQQVKSITKNIDDGFTVLCESEKFSPELVDNLIEEAYKSDCKKLIVLVEDKKYNQYSKAIPCIYGDMFESIEVVPENFTRVQESNKYDIYEGFEADVEFWASQYDEAEADPDEGIVGYIAGKIDEINPSESPEQYESLKRFVMAELKSSGYFKSSFAESVLRENDNLTQAGAATAGATGTDVKGAITQTNEQPALATTTKIVFCDGVIPIANKLVRFVQDYTKKGTKMAFMTLDSAHIYGAAVPNIISNYPQSQSSLSNVADNFDKTVPDFTLNTDPASIVAAFVKVLGLEKRQDKVEVAFNSKYNNFVNSLRAAVQKDPTANGKLEFMIVNGDSLENPNNEKIFNLMLQFKDSKKSLEKDPSREMKWNNDDLGNKNNTIKENYKYICGIASAIDYFEKNKDNKVKDRKSISSAVLEALKAQFLQWSGINNAKTEIKQNSAIGKFAIETAEKVGAAIKKDFQKDKKDDKKKEDPTQRTAKSLYCWKHYEELCKYLDIKPQ